MKPKKKTYFIFVNRKLVPTDGMPKGKTWGPSTLHSRERSHLPALIQTSTQDPTLFSKSAPNLDKSRNAAGNNLAHTTNASSSHNNILGKSVDGLNLIHAGNDNNSYSNSTELGSVDRLNNNHNNTNNEEYNINGDRFIFHDGDDDDDDTDKGCFGFISRIDDSNMKRKKHSLDSRMTDTSPENALHIAVKTSGLPTYASAVQQYDDDACLMRTHSVIEEVPSNRNSEVEAPYDRVFYRAIQKSLDDIFARDDFNRQFSQQDSRHSKSSADLTMFSDSEQQFRFQPFGSSKFTRQCFIVNNNNDENGNRNDSSSDNGNDDDDLDSSNLELSARSNESTSDNITNSISQNDTDPFGGSSVAKNMHLTSRKSSVTFRVDSTDSTQSLTDNNTSNELFYANIDHRTIRDSFVSNDSSNIAFNKRASDLYTPISASNSSSHPDNSDVQAKNAAMRSDSNCRAYSKLKFKNIQRLWRSPRTPSVLHSNSFYKKQDAKTEMNEQLLDEDNESYTNSMNGVEPKYESFRTANFLLAKQNNN